jgi:hypothetical protein
MIGSPVSVYLLTGQPSRFRPSTRAELGRPFLHSLRLPAVCALAQLLIQIIPKLLKNPM